MSFLEKIKDKLTEMKVERRLRFTEDDLEDITTGAGIDKELDPDYVPAETDERDGIGGV